MKNPHPLETRLMTTDLNLAKLHAAVTVASVTDPTLSHLFIHSETPKGFRIGGLELVGDITVSTLPHRRRQLLVHLRRPDRPVFDAVTKAAGDAWTLGKVVQTSLLPPVLMAFQALLRGPRRHTPLVVGTAWDAAATSPFPAGEQVGQLLAALEASAISGDRLDDGEDLSEDFGLTLQPVTRVACLALVEGRKVAMTHEVRLQDPYSDATLTVHLARLASQRRFVIGALT